MWLPYMLLCLACLPSLPRNMLPCKQNKTAEILTNTPSTYCLCCLCPDAQCQIPYFLWLLSKLTESDTHIQIGISLQKHGIKRRLFGQTCYPLNWSFWFQSQYMTKPNHRMKKQEKSNMMTFKGIQCKLICKNSENYNKISVKRH